MPTISNPYSFDSPISGSLDTLAKAFMSAPTEAQKIVQAETALKLQRERQGISDLASAFQQYGTPAYNPNTAGAAIIRGGYDPQKYAVLQRGYTANTYGAQDPRSTNAYYGAGGDYGNTYAGFSAAQAGLDRRNDATLAEKKYEFNNKPTTIGTATGPQIVRQNESYGKPAVEDLGKVKGNAARIALNAPGGLDAASPATKAFIDAQNKNPPTPHMWVDPDGTRHPTFDVQTDAQTGQPLKPGGTLVQVQGTPDQVGMSTTNKAQESNLALERLKEGAKYAEGFIKPQNAGLPGYVKGVAQDMAQVASGISDAFGYHQPAQMLQDLQSRAAQNGVDSKVLAGLFTFDKTLPQLQTAYYALAMNAADAIAGGVGKASDKDMKAVVGMLGSPNELFANPDYLKAKIEAITEYANRMQGVNTRFLHSGRAPAAAQNAPGASPPPPAPGATQFQEGQTATNPNTGAKVIFRGGQWVAQ